MHSWVRIKDEFLDFTVSKFKETVKSPIQAAVEAVNDVVENYPPPYNLFVSGGIDSQAMLYAWKMSKHPFNAYTFRYNQTYNIHDIQTLFLFCEQENIPYTIIDFDSNFTKISADTQGNYFDIYMYGLEPERFYKILIKTVIDGSTSILDNKYFFKVLE
jgi:hypothetical protein